MISISEVTTLCGPNEEGSFVQYFYKLVISYFQVLVLKENFHVWFRVTELVTFELLPHNQLNSSVPKKDRMTYSPPKKVFSSYISLFFECFVNKTISYPFLKNSKFFSFNIIQLLLKFFSAIFSKNCIITEVQKWKKILLKTTTLLRKHLLIIFH